MADKLTLAGIEAELERRYVRSTDRKEHTLGHDRDYWRGAGIADMQARDLVRDLLAQELAEEQYPPSREASAITALQALREAVRRAEEGILAYLGAGGRMGEAIVGILREETGPHMGEESS